MSASEPIAGTAADVSDKEPERYIIMAPDIVLSAFEYPAGTACLHYSGWPADLLTAGIITRAHLKGGKPGHPRANPAPDGGKISVARRWKVKARTGKPARYFDVKLERPMAKVSRWPGALEALATRERHAAWCRERYPVAHMTPEQAAERRATVLERLAEFQREQSAKKKASFALRLVVDNTRVRP